MSEIADSEKRIAAARQSGNLDDLAEALAVHASLLVDAGQLAPAREALDEAAQIHRRQGRPYDEARNLLFAATLYRLEGHYDEAHSRAAHAAQIAGRGNPLAVSSAAELGEIALARGENELAAQLYAQALTDGQALGMTPPHQAALLRKQATALAAAGHFTDAADLLSRAYGLLRDAGEQTVAIRALVERATALQNGLSPAADAARQEAFQAAQAASDHHALADLYLLQAAQEITAGRIDDALRTAQTARSEALEAVAPVSYVSAVVALAELFERQNNRAAAYEALVTGWVTLADLLGHEASRATFEPLLRTQQERWGAAEFASVKQAYEDRRRA